MISGGFSIGSNFSYLAANENNYINFSFSAFSLKGVGFVQSVCKGPTILKACIPVSALVGAAFLSVLFIHHNGKILILFQNNI